MSTLTDRLTQLSHREHASLALRATTALVALLRDDAHLLARAQSNLAKMPGARPVLPDRETRILGALESLPQELEARGNLARLYRQHLQRPGITHPDVTPGAPLWKYSVLLP